MSASSSSDSGGAGLAAQRGAALLAKRRATKRSRLDRVAVLKNDAKERGKKKPNAARVSSKGGRLGGSAYIGETEEPAHPALERIEERLAALVVRKAASGEALGGLAVVGIPTVAVRAVALF